MAVKERFSNGKTAKTVKTVGHLMDELSRLPANTPVRSTFEKSVDVVLFNCNNRTAHVQFCDGGEWDTE